MGDLRMERREALKRQLGLAGAGLEPASGERVFVLDFALPVAALPEWHVLRAAGGRPESEGGTRVRRYLLGLGKGPAAPAPKEALNLIAVECPSALGAVDAVLDHMATCATPAFAPADWRAHDFGDKAWGGPAGPEGAAVFIRGNMAFVVRRALGAPDVTPLGRWVDRLVAKRPGEGDRNGVTAPEFRSFEAGPAIAGASGASGAAGVSGASGLAGAGRELHLEARDPLGRPLWYLLFVVGGEVTRAKGVLHFAPAPGAKAATLDAYCVNENLHWSHRRLGL